MASSETVPLLSPQRQSMLMDRGTAANCPARNLDFDEAERLAAESVIRTDQGELFPLTTPMSELGMLGTGVGLYFNFVRYATAALAVMSVLTLPVMISNFHGSLAFDPEEQIGFPRNIIVASSLGNRPPGQPLLLHSIMDFLCTLAFFCFLIYYRRAQLKTQREIETRVVTAADYSIRVTNLPEDATEDEISEHFSSFGEIAKMGNKEQVTVCYRGYAARAKLLDLREKAEEDVEQFTVQMQSPGQFPDAADGHAAATKVLDRLNTELAALERRRGKEQVCCGTAFVTFKLESACRSCLEQHKQPSLLASLFAGTPRAPFRPFRGSVSLKVAKAPQPSDIIWSNIEVPAHSRALRLAGTSCVALLMLLIATGLIAAVNGKHFFIGNEGVLLSTILNVAAVLIIILSNVSMFVLIPVLSVFEAHTTKGQMELTIMLRLWLFQVLNTMLAAFMFWDASRNKMGQTNWGHWFADGGFLVLNVIFGDATLMNVIEFFRPFDVIIPRKQQAPYCMTQKRLNRVYAAPELSLGMRYQMILKHFTLALALGSAMPLVYWLVTILCGVTYWIDKYNVLRLYRKPALVNNDVGKVAAVYITPGSLLLHLVLAPYFYTVVVSCPTQLSCAPDPLLTPTFVLLAVAAGIVIVLWHPTLHREPAGVEWELVRAREVPYACIHGIETYKPQHPCPLGSESNAWPGPGGRVMEAPGGASRVNNRSTPHRQNRQNADEEIGISVF
mmetsp:Transcript_43945/g.103482  ORF Transcript_43945/g.103482 Transcript_43945/m.103482 type:complete len:730 (+) Transcript_43945:251-2440(+)